MRVKPYSKSMVKGEYVLQLDPKRLEAFLKKNMFFPAEYRCEVYQFMLKNPLAEEAFEALKR
jgi:hypothetical protein